jgi:hypothetical protein
LAGWAGGVLWDALPEVSADGFRVVWGRYLSNACRKVQRKSGHSIQTRLGCERDPIHSDNPEFRLWLEEHETLVLRLDDFDVLAGVDGGRWRGVLWASLLPGLLACE